MWCQHYWSRDDTGAQRSDCLRSGRYRDGIRAHADCRTRPLSWRPRSLLTLFSSDFSSFLLFRMADARNKFTQPDEDTPFGRHLKEVTRYLNIGVPSFTGTYNATLPEDEHWMIQVQVPGRTIMPVTEPIEFSFDVPTWSLGKSMTAHIAMGCIGEVYRKDLKDTIY